MSRNDPIALSDSSSSSESEDIPVDSPTILGDAENNETTTAVENNNNNDRNNVYKIESWEQSQPLRASDSQLPTEVPKAARLPQRKKAPEIRVASAISNSTQTRVGENSSQPRMHHQETIIEIDRSSSDDEMDDRKPAAVATNSQPRRQETIELDGSSISEDNRKPAASSSATNNIQPWQEKIEVVDSSDDGIFCWGPRRSSSNATTGDDPSVIDISSSSDDESEPSEKEEEAAAAKAKTTIVAPIKRKSVEDHRPEDKRATRPFLGNWGFLDGKNNQQKIKNKDEDDPAPPKRILRSATSNMSKPPSTSDANKKQGFKKKLGLRGDPEWMKAVEEAVEQVRAKRKQLISTKAKLLRKLLQKKPPPPPPPAELPLMKPMRKPCHIRAKDLDEKRHNNLPEDGVAVVLINENYGDFDSSVDILDRCYKHENGEEDESKMGHGRQQKIPRYVLDHRIKEVKEVLNLLVEKLGTKGILKRTKEYIAILLDVTYGTVEELFHEQDSMEEQESDEEEQSFDATYRKLMSTPLRLLCKQCQVYDCMMHGSVGEHSSVLATEIAMKKEDSGYWKQLKNQPLSYIPSPIKDISKCHPVQNQSTAMHTEKDGPLSQLDKVMLQQLYFMYKGDLEKVSMVSGISKEAIREENLEEFQYKLLAGRKLDASRFHFANRTTKYRANSFRNDNNRTPVPRAVFTPCCHEEPCSQYNCPCWKNGFACTEHCLWGPLSRNFFPGCNCKGKCTTESCPCHASSRECNPDTCKSCKTCTDTIGSTDRRQQTCCNDNLRMRRRKNTVVGKSNIEGAGLGLFAGTKLKKGEYIDEYVGEVIHDHDGEVTGVEQDKEDRNYIFDLPNEYCVNAMRLGNNTRYMNHAGDNPEDDDESPREKKARKMRATEPNVRAKILTVDGDPRIAFYALKNIAIREELFFDYGKWYFSPNFKHKETGKKVLKRQRA